ncbi:hypothetical protein VFPPC_04883 [Pochonia chlamydosporia 170]|uniref:Uncharacterized protein n=1 Tax=Pochonia chlamydosporia 170 TaxID=1380566 RepID=A0A179FSR0_METCM|nr:hypothetical protein VFPPC_04883 [Pochonia chlamydosporia 170]OAQ68676.2 hypothetical protein VFPPC_04883 [Pochonia chlamydosporia 170]
MRITLLATLLLLSTLACCRRHTRSSAPTCVSDCQKSLAEHGLLADDMKGAYFQCLINICSAKSYGRALAYSVSACCDAGTNIIPLYPIEVRQSQGHKRSLQSEPSDSTRSRSKFTPVNLDFDLSRDFAVVLSCNTGQDGVVTMSLAAPQPTTPSPSMDKNEEFFLVNETPTTVASAIRATKSDKAVLMDASRGTGSDITTDCGSLNGDQRTSSGQTTMSTAFTTPTQTTPCNSNGYAFGSSSPSSTDHGFGQTSSTTGRMNSAAPCTSSYATRSENSQGSPRPTSWSESGFGTSGSLTSSCTSSTSQADRASNSWRSSDPNSPTADCSDGVDRSSIAAGSRTSTYGSQTFDSNSWSTTRVSDTETPCSSDLSSLNGVSFQSSRATSTSSRFSSASTSCTDSSRASSATSANPDSTPCSSVAGSGTSRRQPETASISNSLSSTSSYTFTTSTSSEGGFAASPAAYTFASPSLPPAYIPPLEEYGYGTPPPVYGFPTQTNGVDGSWSSMSTYTSSAPTRESNSASGRQNSGPAIYDTSTGAPTQMAQVAPVHATNPVPEATPLKDTSETVKVTLISSVEGEGMRTTILTVHQAQASSLAIPSAIVLNNPADTRKNSSTASGNSESGGQDSGSVGDIGDSPGVDHEMSMPVFVGASSTTEPSLCAVVGTVLLAAGFAICTL